MNVSVVLIPIMSLTGDTSNLAATLDNESDMKTIKNIVYIYMYLIILILTLGSSALPKAVAPVKI